MKPIPFFRGTWLSGPFEQDQGPGLRAFKRADTKLQESMPCRRSKVRACRSRRPWNACSRSKSRCFDRPQELLAAEQIDPARGGLPTVHGVEDDLAVL